LVLRPLHVDLLCQVTILRGSNGLPYPCSGILYVPLPGGARNVLLPF